MHRALCPRPGERDQPRDVICRLHRYVQKELIMKAAWQKGTVDFAEVAIYIYPDISWATLMWRAMLKPLLASLRSAQLQYRWGFPLQLTIRKEGSSYTLRRHTDLPDLFEFLGMEAIPLQDWLCPLPGRDPRTAPLAPLPARLHRSSSRRRREPTPIRAQEPEL